MKARHYLFSFAALLALAACSDAVTDEASASTDSDSTGNSYMAVTLSMASSASTRSATYAYGTEAESNILVSNDYSIFLFYDTDGNYVTSGEFSGETSTYISPTSTSTTDTDSGSNVVSGTHTVALGPTSSIPEEGLQLLVVLNYPGGDITDLKYLSLTNAIAQVVKAKAASVTVNSTATDFYLMTSALCYSESKLVSTTSITSENIFDSATDAANNSVKVYVEREVAKVDVELNSKNFTSTTENGTTKYAALITNNAEDLETAANIKYKSSSSNAENVQLRVVVEGWAINATNSTGYVFKNSDNNWTPNDYLATDWYDTEVGGRYFWAKDMNYDYSNSSTSNDGINYLSYSDVTATSTDAAYYHENTAVDSYGNQTTLVEAGQSAVLPTLLLTGKLQISTDGSKWEDIDDALYEKDGMYYSLAGVKAVLAAYIYAEGYYWYANSEYTAISGDDFANIEFELAATDNSSRVQVSSVTMKAPSTLSSPSLVLKSTTDGGSDTTVAENVDSTNGTKIVDSSSTTTYEDAQKAFITALNNTALLAITEGDSSSGLQCFTEGMCYYQAPIQHMTVNGTIYYGMVRNTWYSLTINSITHVGAPVYDDEEELEVIPGKETYYYINLSLNVLSWLDASDQTIDF